MNRRLGWFCWVVIGIGGCGRTAFDEVPDAPPSPVGASLCFGSVMKQCLQTIPAVEPWIVDSTAITRIDTDTSERCAPQTLVPGSSDCVIVTGDLTLMRGTLRFEGSRPVILLSLGTITIESATRLDVSSHTAVSKTDTSSSGAGVMMSLTCTAGTPPAEAAGGGGYGGTFHGFGGDGQASQVPGAGGIHAQQAVTKLPRLRAGCPGSSGQPNRLPVGAGQGGRGGGAVALIAKKIVVNGIINASGAGGGGGVNSGDKGFGGGGGGTGGMIVLDTPALTLDPGGQLFANGGGGGEAGGGLVLGATGGESPEPGAPGKGGLSEDNKMNGSGGDGSSNKGAVCGDTTTGDLDGTIGTRRPPVGSGGGGGGGGGGAGFIYAPGATGSNISPCPSPAP